ncbi:hypothetical protein NPIL_387821 [Nephila pilipes]|uniref:Uncharacterized protein n=1 Tax=Nephila pilipes TaxID=299642 RepID=A0A8X6QAD6_NEPPI|nr:hypothetical protein NPIL_387821 [Nephila pilipes]
MRWYLSHIVTINKKPTFTINGKLKTSATLSASMSIVVKQNRPILYYELDEESKPYYRLAVHEPSKPTRNQSQRSRLREDAKSTPPEFTATQLEVRRTYTSNSFGKDVRDYLSSHMSRITHARSEPSKEMNPRDRKLRRRNKVASHPKSITSVLTTCTLCAQIPLGHPSLNW